MDPFLIFLKNVGLADYYKSLTLRDIRNAESLKNMNLNNLSYYGIKKEKDIQTFTQVVQKLQAELNKKKNLRNETPVHRTLPRTRLKVTPTKATTTLTPKTSRTFDSNSNKLESNKQNTSFNISPKKSNKSSNEILIIEGRKTLGLNAYGVPIKNIKTVKNKNETLTKLTSRLSLELAEKIRVCVRKRPLSAREIKRNEEDIIQIIGRRALALNEPKVKLDGTKYIDQHKFIFDETFDADATNEQVYNRTAKPLVNHVFQGGNATCFAYGQTGSGKTYTMLDEMNGLYVLAARDMFELLDLPNYHTFSLHISFYEIYQGQLYDLLSNRKKLNAREDGKQQIIIQGLREIKIINVDQLLEVYQYGASARSTGSTGANTDSSRSHAIMQLALKERDSAENFSKFTFIDLAGSERGADRGKVSHQTRMEGAEINKSLLALKECIRALDQNKNHLPFRQSKLTQVLKDSFLGESRTCMIANIAPNILNSEHTLNTLRYSDRVKELRGEIPEDEDEGNNENNSYQYDKQGELYYEEKIEMHEEPNEIIEYEESDLIVERGEDDSTQISLEEEIEEDVENETLPEIPMNFEDDIEIKKPISQAIIDIPTHLKLNSSINEDSSFDDLYYGYDIDCIQRLAREHRNQIFKVTEIAKSESQLLCELTENLHKLNFEPNRRDDYFEWYMMELDEFLERKLVIIEDLKEQLALEMLKASERKKAKQQQNL